ncbi:MAG: hypothetical protein R2733_26195 [Acidimicrobiales bacterium]
MNVPAPPSSPPPTAGRVPEGARLALAAVAAAALVLVALVAVTGRRFGTSDAEAATGGLTSSAEGTASPESNDDGDETTAGTPVDGCPEGTIIEVCDAVAFIEEFKGGRPFKTFPTVNFIDEAAFDEFLLADFADAEEDLRNSGDSLRSLGLIEPDVDLADALRTTLELGVVGAYNTETGELNVNGTEVNLYTQMVMVHELTHAWDDQYFELSRPEYDLSDDEIGSGFLHVVEGSATLVEQAWRASLTPAEQSELDALELGAIAPEDLDLLFTVPMFVLQLQISPYTDGASFVQAIYDAGGIDAVDALFDSPPTTTEQVFHLDAYDSGEPALPVAEDSPSGDAFDRGVLGEVTFNLWFGPEVGDGWGGDRYVSWRSAGQVCTAVTVTGDTEADTAEFGTAFDDWAAAAPAGSKRTVTESDGIVTATGCL